MTKRANSPIEPTNPESDNFISVREAARRLTVSTSTIYRMRRGSDGPFKIFNVDRRVLIDRVSFEKFLASQGATAVSGDQEPATIRPEADSPLTSGCGAHQPRTGSGQRELIITAPRPFIILYMA